MTIEIITTHEADQLIRMRRPLGTDYQGRYPEAAHPATDIGADAEEWAPLSVRERLMFWVPVCSITVGLVAFVLYAAGVRL